MRHLILTSEMVRNFFKSLYFSQFVYAGAEVDINENDLKKYEDKFNFWIKSVDAYESLFFKQDCLPNFLKDVARLDVIRYVTKDLRPQSRKYWLERAEDDPTQIRAVAWIRGLLLSGLHFEWMGSHIWVNHPRKQLNECFKQNITFNNCIKSIAYACARTNIGVTWRLLQCTSPSLSDLKHWVEPKTPSDKDATHTKQMLANIHLLFLQSMKLVFKAIYNKILSEEELFAIDRLSLLAFWPNLQQEVSLREKQLELFYDILVNQKQNLGILDQDMLQDIYGAFLNESNMAASFYMTHHQQTLAPIYTH